MCDYRYCQMTDNEIAYFLGFTCAINDIAITYVRLFYDSNKITRCAELCASERYLRPQNSVASTTFCQLCYLSFCPSAM
jgi:hypothetical protein